MKNILGIVASPRKLGNSEIMVKEISRHIELPHQLNLLRLSDFNIQPCRGCYHCLSKTCILKDDHALLIEAFLAADAIIAVAPSYFLGANALLKLALDRSLALHSHQERMWGKPSVGIAIAGVKGMEGRTLLDIQSFLKLTLTDIKGSTVVYGAFPGEVFINDQNRAVAAEMGRRLFAAKPATMDGPCCPLCGGDTFRFLDDNQVRCMLCSNTGHFAVEDGRTVFMIIKSPNDFFLTKAGAREHTGWLRGMKSNFARHKDALAEVVKSYRNDGQWVRPPKE